MFINKQRTKAILYCDAFPPLSNANSSGSMTTNDPKESEYTIAMNTLSIDRGKEELVEHVERKRAARKEYLIRCCKRQEKRNAVVREIVEMHNKAMQIKYGDEWYSDVHNTQDESFESQERLEEQIFFEYEREKQDDLDCIQYEREAEERCKKRAERREKRDDDGSVSNESDESEWEFENEMFNSGMEWCNLMFDKQQSKERRERHWERVRDEFEHYSKKYYDLTHEEISIAFGRSQPKSASKTMFCGTVSLSNKSNLANELPSPSQPLQSSLTLMKRSVKHVDKSTRRVTFDSEACSVTSNKTSDTTTNPINIIDDDNHDNHDNHDNGGDEEEWTIVGTLHRHL